MNEGKEEGEGGKEEGRKVERNGARGKVGEGGMGPGWEEGRMDAPVFETWLLLL